MTAAAAPPRARWILSAFWDSVLFIGAPVLCVVTLVPLRALWPSAAYSTFLLAFFTFGHHLPGFLRAYGDRELFTQYRWRFLLAPPWYLWPRFGSPAATCMGCYFWFSPGISGTC